MTFISNDCVLYHQTKHINQFLVSIFLIQPLKTLLVELTETRYVGQNLNLMMIPAFHVFFIFWGKKPKRKFMLLQSYRHGRIESPPLSLKL